MSNPEGPTTEALNPLNSPEELKAFAKQICDIIIQGINKNLELLKFAVSNDIDAIDEYCNDGLNTPKTVRGLLEKTLTTEEVTRFFEAEVEGVDWVRPPQHKQTIQNWLDAFDTDLAGFLKSSEFWNAFPTEVPDAFKIDLKQIITKGFIKLVLPSESEIAELEGGGYLNRPVAEMTDGEIEAFARRIIIFTTEEVAIAQERAPERYLNINDLRPFIIDQLRPHLTEEQIESLLDQGVDMTLATNGQITSKMAAIRGADWIDVFAESLVYPDAPGNTPNEVIETVFTKALKELREQAKMSKSPDRLKPLAAEVQASFALLEDMLDDAEKPNEALKAMVADLKEKVEALLEGITLEIKRS